MPLTVEATYENGTLKLAQPLPLKEHEKLQVTIHVPVTTVKTPAEIQAALDAVQRSYGLLGWTSDAETVRRVALDPEFGIEESP